MKLVVLDLETSGLLIKDHVTGDESPHAPGRHADCILEVGLVILDAETLVEEARHDWLVLPPSIDSEAMFDAWETTLRETNKFVFDLHSKEPHGAPGTIFEGGSPSLLFKLRQAATYVSDTRNGTLPSTPDFPQLNNDYIKAQANAFAYTVVQEAICAVLKKHSARAEPGMHPGNSDLMFTGNSIANLDIPMLRLWMPEVHKLLSYRILDVSVLRTFYQDIAKVPIPQKLADDIKSGGGGHRALADAVFCAQSLRELVDYARFGSYGPNGAEGPNGERGGLGGFGGTFEQLARENVRLRELIAAVGAG